MSDVPLTRAAYTAVLACTCRGGGPFVLGGACGRSVAMSRLTWDALADEQPERSLRPRSPIGAFVLGHPVHIDDARPFGEVDTIVTPESERLKPLGTSPLQHYLAVQQPDGSKIPLAFRRDPDGVQRATWTPTQAGRHTIVTAEEPK